MRPERIRLLLLLTSAVLMIMAISNIVRCTQENSAPKLGSGATGLRVTALQWLLNAGRAEVSVTGTYADKTIAAVRAFQNREGLDETGEVDSRTFDKLTPNAKPGDRGLQVRAVQTLLTLHEQPAGIYDDFDAATEEAVKKFQDAAGLKETGEVDRDTWDALFAGPSTGPTVSETDQFLATIAPHAQENFHLHGVPVAVAMAQASQETGWGRAAPGNNYFGIKCHSQSSRPVAYTCDDRITNEWENGEKMEIRDSFRTYASLRDSTLDYGNFLRSNTRYARAFTHRSDPDSFAKALQEAGYATDPTYADSLIQIMQSRDLYAYAT
jgi:flagellum-specific peptidoglycan hydrolase FlgJ